MTNADANKPYADHDEPGESTRAPRRPRSEPPTAAPQEREEAPARPEPWWHSKLLVSVLTLIGASIAPGTAWLSAQQERSTEAERAKHVQALQEQQQQHAVRMEFFEKVVSPTIAMTPESRMEALRYFQAVLPTGDLRKWAETEYQSLQQLIAERRSADEQRARVTDAAHAAAATVDAALGELEATPTDDVERRQALTAEIDHKATEAKQQAQRAQQAERTVESIARKLADSVPVPMATKGGAALPSAESALVKPSANAREMSQQDALTARAAVPDTAAVPLELAFDARRTLLAESKSETYYRFSAAIDAPAQVLSRIARVQYLFDHPTFTQKNLQSSDRSAKFEVSYRGWGCLTNVVATLTLLNGQTVQRTFDMCAAIK